ncbi:MAG: hypothetical protein ABIJ59_02305 [Pseudomonadota bacterium]
MSNLRKVYNKGKSKVTDEQIEYALRRLKDDRASQQQVCKELNIHVITLKRAFKANGLTIDPDWRRPSQKLYDTATRLLQNGLTYKQVSEILDLPQFALHGYFTNCNGRPSIDFEMTEDKLLELKRGLLAGESLKIISEKLETREAFVTLMVVWLGCKDYLKQRSRKSNSGLTEKKIKKYIRLRFKGYSNAHLIEELKTTKPTFNKLCTDIQSHYMQGIGIAIP